MRHVPQAYPRLAAGLAGAPGRREAVRRVRRPDEPVRRTGDRVQGNDPLGEATHSGGTRTERRSRDAPGPRFRETHGIRGRARADTRESGPSRAAFASSPAPGAAAASGGAPPGEGATARAHARALRGMLRAGSPPRDRSVPTALSTIPGRGDRSASSAAGGSRRRWVEGHWARRRVPL